MHFGDEITFPLPGLFSFKPVAKLKWYCNFYFTQNWSVTKPAPSLSQKYFNFKIWFCPPPDPKLLCNVKLRKRRSLKKVHLPPGLTLHYGLRADILKKVTRKCLTLKIDFSANFNLTHDLFWAEALSTSQKLENAKMNLQISI